MTKPPCQKILTIFLSSTNFTGWGSNYLYRGYLKFPGGGGGGGGGGGLAADSYKRPVALVALVIFQGVRTHVFPRWIRPCSAFSSSSASVVC